MLKKDNDRQRMLKAKQFVAQRKLEIGKCQCGECDHVVTKDNLKLFEFDHIDPRDKKLPISHMARGRYSIEAIQEELKKCQLLWYQCHHKKTVQDASNAMPPFLRQSELFTDSDQFDVHALEVRSFVERQLAKTNTIACCEEDGFIVNRLSNGEAISCIRKRDNQYFARTQDDRWIPCELWTLEKHFGLLDHDVIVVSPNPLT
jgi:hypothetical protein